jgi:K+-sensing histidine kinase KdpD
VAVRAAGLAPGSPAVRDLDDAERDLVATRRTAVRLADERERLRRTQRDGIPATAPHAHLRHRRTPIEASERGRSRFLSGWAVVSTPLVLWLVSVLLRPDLFDRWSVAVLLLVAVVSIEAFARGYLMAFLGRLLLLILVVNLLVLFVANWQQVTSVVLAVLAFVVLVVNIRDVARR